MRLAIRLTGNGARNKPGCAFRERMIIATRRASLCPARHRCHRGGASSWRIAKRVSATVCKTCTSTASTFTSCIGRCAMCRCSAANFSTRPWSGNRGRPQRCLPRWPMESRQGASGISVWPTRRVGNDGFFTPRQCRVRHAALATSAGLTLVQLAMAFCRSRLFIASTIVGATGVAQLHENIDAFSIALDADTLVAIDDIHLGFTNPAL